MASRSVLSDRLYQYGLLMRLDRPIGALLLLWPTLWALWIAGEGRPDPGITIIFILGVFVMRSAGCVINDYADRDFDGRVARTRDRPLAAGRVSSREALTLFTVLVLVSLGLVLLLNGLTIALSGIAIALAASYPFMKRYTYLPQIHLGLAFGWGVPMSFAALEQAVPPVAWLILVAVILWAVVYDTMYAMVDRDDDIRIGVKSTAILFGPADKLAIGVTQIVFLLVLLLIGENAGLGGYYNLGLVVAVILSGYQQYLLRTRDPALCFKAFLNNNWLGAAVFAGIVAHYALGGT